MLNNNHSQRQTRGKKSYRQGIGAERWALLFFFCKLYWPIARRVRTPVGEIDLILKRGNVIVFVEIKKRVDIGTAAESIFVEQQRRIIRAAQFFLSKNVRYSSLSPRFDALLIGEKSWPLHIKNAWQSAD